MPYRTRLQSSKRTVTAALDKAATRMVWYIAHRSQAIVPVDTGALRKSMRVHKGKGGRMRVTYGSPKVRYAAIVHNKPGVRYRNGQWMYLRTPLMESRKILAELGKAGKLG